jgi:hypothetical protein
MKTDDVKEALVITVMLSVMILLFIYFWDMAS